MIIRDPATQSFLYDTLRHDFRYSGIVWIGLTDEVSEDSWVWVDGGCWSLSFVGCLFVCQSVSQSACLPACLRVCVLSLIHI